MIKIKVFFLAVIITATSIVANAQTEGSVFNPYSQYGLGSLSTVGTAATKGMGGIGVATRDSYGVNLLNPAGYTSIERQNAIFSIGGEGVNNYLRTVNGKNSKNFFNLGHIALQFRLSKKFAFGFSMNPYSDTGYELTVTDKSNDIVTNIGNVKYDYVGTGSVVQFKTGVGYSPFNNFSIGINYLYYLGTINHQTSSIITSYVNTTQSFKNTYDYKKGRVNQSSFEIGAQYTIRMKEGKGVNFGATFQPRMASNIKREVFIASGYSESSILPNDIAVNKKYNEKYYFPMRLSFGAAYNTQKMTVEMNYNYQDWSKSFPQNNIAGVSYSTRNEIRAGIQYTPNRFDIRSHMKRWTYRAGLIYGTSYIVKNGYQSNDYAATIGIGVPLERDWLSMLNIAAEFGTAGTTKNKQIRDNFIKLNIGFNFAAKNWFIRYKYK